MEGEGSLSGHKSLERNRMNLAAALALGGIASSMNACQHWKGKAAASLGQGGGDR